MDIEKFKKISINGRLAYSIYSLGIFIQKKNTEFYDNPIINLILNEMSEGLNEKFPEDFEEKITELAPSSVLDEHPSNDFNEYIHFTKTELERIKELYIILPKPIIKIIDSIIELSLCNIYKSTGEYSECTYNELVYIINILDAEDFNLPIIPEYILNSTFDINNGWGNKIVLNGQ